MKILSGIKYRYIVPGTSDYQCNGKGDHWSIKIQKKFKAHLCHTLDLYWELWTACLQSRLKQRYSYFGPIQANIIKYERFCLKVWKLRDSPFRKTDANCIIASEGFPLGCVLTKLIFSCRDQSFSWNIWKEKINLFYLRRFYQAIWDKIHCMSRSVN